MTRWKSSNLVQHDLSGYLGAHSVMKVSKFKKITTRTRPPASVATHWKRA